MADAINTARREGRIENTPAQKSSVGSNLEQIKQLAELLQMRAITQEEFDAKKKQLLAL